MKKDRNTINLDHIANQDFNSLLTGNQRYINRIAYSFGVEDQEVIEDLKQCGRIGLYTAYTRFEPDKCPIFISFAGWYIRKEMLHFLENQSDTIRKTITVRKMIKEGTLAPIQTLSTALVIDENGTTIEDRIGNPEEDVPYDTSPLKAILADVKETERELLQQRFGLNGTQAMTYDELAEYHGCSKQNIQEKIKRIIKRIQKKQLWKN